MAKADEQLFLWLNSGVGKAPLFDQLVRYLVSDYLVPVAALIFLLGLWFAGSSSSERLRIQIGIFVVLVSMALSSLAVFIVNAFYSRPRPFLEHSVDLLFYWPTDSSFPSNPIAATFAIAFGVWLINRRLGLALMVIVAAYALARVYSGVHYPLDVVASIAIAIAVTLAVAWAERLVRPVLKAALRFARLFCVA